MVWVSVHGMGIYSWYEHLFTMLPSVARIPHGVDLASRKYRDHHSKQERVLPHE